MTRWTLYFFTIFLLLGHQSNGQTKDTIYVQVDTVILKRDTLLRNLLMQVNLKNYVGKTVAELLDNDTIKLYQKYWWSTEPPGKLQSLNLTYAKGLYLTIYPVTKGGAVQFSELMNFDFDMFKKEKIEAVKIDKSYFEENVVKKYAKKK